ncbi:MAG: MFS transporter, partial [Candidatus Limnocylindria bacterium]
RSPAEPAPAERAPAEPARRPIDAPGLLLLALALAALLVFVLEGATLLGLAAAVSLPLVLAALVLVEQRTDHPAIDPRLFSRPAFSAAVLGVLGTTVTLHGTFILVPLLVERVLLESATTAGLVLLGIFAASSVVAPLGGHASDRIGRRAPAVMGAVVTAAGLGALALLVSGQSLGAGAGSALALGLLLGVVGAGFGLAGSPRQAAALEAVASHQVGIAAATYFTGRYLGGVLGATLAGLVLGGAVTGGGVALGFAILAGVALAVALVSVALPGRPRLP